MALVVAVEDLRKRYRARDPYAVDSVSFSLEPGEAFGLLGPNGAGKSSIVKIIAGLTRPSSGRVTLVGGSPQDPAARAALGFAAEEPDFPKYLCADEVLDYFGRLLGLPGASGAGEFRKPWTGARSRESAARCGTSPRA
jgi:ABC-2 type transport system ATP-binding protein